MGRRGDPEPCCAASRTPPPVPLCPVCLVPLRSQLQQPRWEIVNFPQAQVLHLSYHDGEHYNSVRNADDNGSDVPTPIVIRAPTAGPGAAIVVRRVVRALGTVSAPHLARCLGRGAWHAVHRTMLSRPAKRSW